MGKSIKSKLIEALLEYNIDLDKWKYIAQDSDGRWYLYSTDIELQLHSWNYDDPKGDHEHFHFDNEYQDWTRSKFLIENMIPNRANKTKVYSIDMKSIDVTPNSITQCELHMLDAIKYLDDEIAVVEERFNNLKNARSEVIDSLNTLKRISK